MGDILGEIFEKIFDTIIGKILVVILLPFLPIIAILGGLHVTGNYWWDLLISFAFPGFFALFIWFFYIKD